MSSLKSQQWENGNFGVMQGNKKGIKMDIKDLLDALDGYGLVLTDDELIEERLKEIEIDPNAQIKFLPNE